MTHYHVTSLILGAILTVGIFTGCCEQTKMERSLEYEEGIKSHNTGMSLHENPYSDAVGRKEREHKAYWTNGWLDAELEEQEHDEEYESERNVAILATIRLKRLEKAEERIEELEARINTMQALQEEFYATFRNR